MYGQQSGDQFQTLHDQPLTYSFSGHVPANKHSDPQRPKKKNQQKLTLNIVKPLNTIKENQAQNSQNKFHRRSMYTNEGKIIKIGEATFKSNFQCGSLGQVHQLKAHNTFLIKMDKQINSNRPSAWFYFRCQGLKGEVNFIISGFTKSSSLYNEGMKVCYRQIKKPDPHENHHFQNHGHKNKSDWHRGCSKISYSGNYDPQTDQNIYQLKFTYNFTKNFETHDYPPVQFAYCYPYEYKRVSLLTKSLVKKGGVILESLGKTYEGRDIPILTIGNPNAQKSIVLSARVHPGETVGSFIMEGLLKQLISDNQFSQTLKEKYLFKIVPMINPDGVVRGNYRFSAAGYDLNRRWKHCYESSHPEVFYLKSMMKKLHKQKRVVMYIDIHGHSRKKSAFFYGCCGSKDGQYYGNEEQNMTKPKQFPFLMSKLNPNFKYDYCTFNMSKDKQGTARITMFKQLHIDHIYTLESSFCNNADGGQNYTEDDFMNMGKSLLEGISVYFYDKHLPSPRQTTMSESIEISGHVKQKHEKNSVFDKFIHILNDAKEQLKNSPQLLNMGMNGSESGSDSQPEAGIIPQEQRQMKSTNLNLQIPGMQKSKSRQKSSQFFPESKSPANLKVNKSIKITVRQTQHKKKRITPQELKSIVDGRLEDLRIQQSEKNMFQKQIIAKTVNNFYSANSQQLDSLTSDSLMKKNERVHSKQGNTRNMLQKLKSQRLNSQNPISSHFEFDKDDIQNQEQQERRKLQQMTRNLLKTREGVQYRRVKKLAEQMKKKTQNTYVANSFQQPPIPIVRGIVTVNNQLNLQKKRIKSIAPSFYPQSQQKNRRFSVQMAYRNNSFRSGKLPFEIGNKKFVINGDDINVHCKGTKIYI